MPRYPVRDCECEDFPLCIHADNFPDEPEYCDLCGYHHPVNYECTDPDFPVDWEAD